MINSKKKYAKIAQKVKKKLSNNSTSAEIVFKKILLQLKIAHQTQQIIYVFGGFFVADFTATNKEGKRYLLEIDGGYHFNWKQKQKDKKRSTKIRASGYGVLRFKNNEVFNDQEKVVRKLKKYKLI